MSKKIKHCFWNMRHILRLPSQASWILIAEQTHRHQDLLPVFDSSIIQLTSSHVLVIQSHIMLTILLLAPFHSAQIFNQTKRTRLSTNLRPTTSCRISFVSICPAKLLAFNFNTERDMPPTTIVSHRIWDCLVV